MKKIVLFFVTCVVGLVAEERVVAPPVSVAPVIAPKSFLGMRKKLCLQYVATNPVLTSPELKPFSEQISKILTPLTKEDALNRIALRQDISVLVKALQADKNLTQPLRTKVIHLLANIQHALRPWLGRHWKKIAGGVFGVSAVPAALWLFLLFNPRLKNRLLKRYLKWRITSGWGRDESGNVIPAYALGQNGVSAWRKYSLERAAQKHVVVGGVKKKKAVEYLSSIKQMRRNFAINRSAKLRKYVVKPNQDGNVFERAAFAVGQTSWLSVEALRRQQEEAAPFIRERMEKLVIAPQLGADMDFPEHLIYETQYRSGGVSSGYGSVVKLKKVDYGYAEGDFEGKLARLELDGTLVERFYPTASQEGGKYKYVPGEGYIRIRKPKKAVWCPDDNSVKWVHDENAPREVGGYEPQYEESVIIKVPNPYAFRKTHETQRLMGAGGENHGLDRHVRRVLVAGEVRRRAVEGTEVRSDVMVEGWLEEQEREQEAAAQLAAADEPFVLEPDDYQQGDGEEGKDGAGEDAAVAAIVADDAEVEIPPAAPLQVLPRITTPRKYLALRPGAEGRLIDDRTAVVMTECLEPDSSLEYADFTDAEIDRLIQICDDFDLTDIHPWNIMRSKGRFYMIDLEKVAAYPKRLRDDFRYMAFRLPGVFPDVLAKRIRDRLRAMGKHVTEFDGTK